MFLAILICECRILYTNASICEFLESPPFKANFIETHTQLKQLTQHSNVKEAIDDVM